MSIRRALAIFFCIPVAIQVILLGSMFLYLNDLRTQINHQVECKKLQAYLDTFQRLQSESLSLAFLASITGYERLKQRHKVTIIEINKMLPELRRQCEKTPELSVLVDEITRTEKQLINLQLMVQTVSLAMVLPSQGETSRGTLLVRQAKGSVRHALSKLEDTDVVVGSVWAKQLILALALTIVVYAFELALAINWSSRVFGKRLDSVFESMAKLKDSEGRRASSADVRGDEIAQVEAAVINAGEEIRRLESCRRELSSIVAHDLRVPLTSIAGSLELLEKGTFGDIPTESLPKILQMKRVSDNLVFAINLLLEFAKLDSADRVQVSTASARQFEDALYEELENFGLADLEKFSCELSIKELKLPVVPVAKLVAFLIKAMGKPRQLTVEAKELQGNTVVRIFFPIAQNVSPQLDSFQTKSLEMASLMSKIYGAQFSYAASTDDKTSDNKDGDEDHFAIKIAFSDHSGEQLSKPIEPTWRKTRWPFKKKLVTLLVVTLSINLATASCLLFAWQAGQRQLSNETTSRRITHLASTVTADLMELMILCLLRDPQIEGDRNRLRRHIDLSMQQLEQRASSASKDQVEKWKLNIQRILVNTEQIAAATPEQLSQRVKHLVDTDNLDGTLIAHTGRFIVSNEQAYSSSSEKLLDLFEQFSKQMITISMVGAFASLAAAFFMSRYLILRLEHMRKNADLLRTRQPLSRPGSGKDDLAALDRFLYDTASRIDSLERDSSRLLTLLRDDLAVPINNIRATLVEIEVKAPLPVRAKEQLDVVDSELTRLSFLIDDLQCANSMGVNAKELSINLSFTDVHTVIKETVAAATHQAQQKSVVIEQNIQLDEETRIQADEKRLVQILVNLLVNAIKASNSGDTVTIEATQTADAVTIAITDRGCGIPSHSADKLFQRFSRLDEKEGVGLGLFIAKLLAELQGGKIGFQSKEGEGSRFWVRFPL